MARVSRESWAARSGAGVAGISSDGRGRNAEASANATSACRELGPGNSASQRPNLAELTRSVSSRLKSCLATFASGLPCAFINSWSTFSTETSFAENAGGTMPASHNSSASFLIVHLPRRGVSKAQLLLRESDQSVEQHCNAIRRECAFDVLRRATTHLCLAVSRRVNLFHQRLGKVSQIGFLPTQYEAGMPAHFIARQRLIRGANGSRSSR